MDTLLILVTALSLLMAAAMAIVVMKLLRDERRRSDARVAALTEMAADEEVGEAKASPYALRLKPEATRTKRAVDDLPIRAEVSEESTDVRRLFDEPQRSSPWAGRLAIIATIVIVVGGGGWLLLHAPSGGGVHDAAATTVASERAPLELLSLGHAQEADRLTITGLVQNPRTGAPLTRVVATAFAFGPDGTFIASGRAPIDFMSLGAGDKSPFVVTIPASGAVARYRVGFRAEDGTVIAHVDRRTDTLAQK